MAHPVIHARTQTSPSWRTSYKVPALAGINWSPLPLWVISLRAVSYYDWCTCWLLALPIFKALRPCFSISKDPLGQLYKYTKINLKHNAESGCNDFLFIAESDCQLPKRRMLNWDHPKVGVSCIVKRLCRCAEELWLKKRQNFPSKHQPFKDCRQSLEAYRMVPAGLSVAFIHHITCIKIGEKIQQTPDKLTGEALHILFI